MPGQPMAGAQNLRSCYCFPLNPTSPRITPRGPKRKATKQRAGLPLGPHSLGCFHSLPGTAAQTHTRPQAHPHRREHPPPFSCVCGSRPDQMPEAERDRLRGRSTAQLRALLQLGQNKSLAFNYSWRLILMLLSGDSKRRAEEAVGVFVFVLAEKGLLGGAPGKAPSTGPD